MDEFEIRLINILSNMEKSLSSLAEDTKANKKLREENQELFLGLEKSIKDLKENPFGLNKGDSWFNLRSPF